jgi:rubrerythrin
MALSGGAVKVHITPGSRGERLDEMQREIDEMRNRIADIENAANREIAKVRSELERRAEELEMKIASAIEEARGEYFIWRACGFLIALAGSVVLALSNLL